MAVKSLKRAEDFIGFDSSSSSDGEISEVEEMPTSRKRKAEDTEELCYNGSLIPPWLESQPKLGGTHEYPDISQMLNEEVTKFVHYISPTPEEHQMRGWVVERLQKVLDAMPLSDVSARARCFGSFETRLYLPTSDIDMTIMVHEKTTDKVSWKYESKESIRRFLYVLAKELKKAGFCRSCEVIGHARVPIIKTKEMISGYAVDISINADNGIKSAQIQRSFSESIYPESLRSMVLVIKQFLAQRSLNEVYTGGIGSYAITLLCVSLFQMHPRIMSGGLDASKNLGVLLLEFFELYGKRFNYDNVCVSVLEKGRYLRKQTKGFYNMSQPWLLSIEDPCDQYNDVAKGTYGINRIKQTFSGAYDLLSNAVFAYHQTRKFGEPINQTLRESMSGKRMRGRDGKRMRLFTDDPSVPVSFLSSILNVDPRVIGDRQRVIEVFNQGKMQRLLGVKPPEVTVGSNELGKFKSTLTKDQLSVNFVECISD